MKRNTRVFSIISVTFTVAILFFLPHLTPVLAQTTTPTAAETDPPSATPTPSQTPTVPPSITPTSTGTETPTPTYAVATGIAEIKELLNTTDSNTEQEGRFWGFLRRLGEDNFFTFVWTVITQPFISLCWIILAGIPVVSRFEAWRRGLLDRLRARSQDNRGTTAAQEEASPPRPAAIPRRGNWARTVADLSNLLVLIGVIILFFPFVVVPGVPSREPPPVIPTSVTETSLPTSTAVIAFTASPTQVLTTGGGGTSGIRSDVDPERRLILLITAEALGIGLLAFLVISAARLHKYQPGSYDVNVSGVEVQELGRSLLPAGFVVLVFLILPNPVDAVLLPLLMPFLLFGFFDVVRAYPNLYLKQLVSKHYTRVIYYAEVGAWFGFLSVLQGYTAPLYQIHLGAWGWVIGQAGWDRSLFDFPQIIWAWAPLLLAFCLAIRPSQRIREVAEQRHIREIQRSAETLSKQ